MTNKHRTCPVPAEDRARLRQIVDQEGEGRAIEISRLPRSTMTRVLADLPVRPGTAAMLRQSLDAVGPAAHEAGHDAR